MRGRQDPQVTLLAFIDLETRVPSDHPLRVVKRLAALTQNPFSEGYFGSAVSILGQADLRTD